MLFKDIQIHINNKSKPTQQLYQLTYLNPEELNTYFCLYVPE